MGNYYSGMMNATGGSELRHHGILGQKWGVRRFQNKDGSLTNAGRERHGYSGVSDKERKKLNKLLLQRPRNPEATMKMSAVQNAARQLVEEAANVDQLSKKHDAAEEQLMDHVYNNKEVYEKWLNKAVDNYMRDYADDPGGTREQIYNWFKYDDGDQNEHGVFETYVRESGDKAAKDYKKLDNDYWKANSDLFQKAQNAASDILGDPSKMTMQNMHLASDIRDLAKKYKDNPLGKTSAQMEKDYKKYQRLQGTKSLLGGDHSKDESVKALTAYQNEIYANRKNLRNRDKDSYKEGVAKIASKHIDNYAKGVLKDMGYDTSPEAVAWLKQQPWFYMSGAGEIVF